MKTLAILSQSNKILILRCCSYYWISGKFDNLTIKEAKDMQILLENEMAKLSTKLTEQEFRSLKDEFDMDKTGIILSEAVPNSSLPGNRNRGFFNPYDLQELINSDSEVLSIVRKIATKLNELGYVASQASARESYMKITDVYLDADKPVSGFIEYIDALGMQQEILSRFTLEEAQSHFCFVHLFSKPAVDEYEAKLISGEIVHPLGIAAIDANKFRADKIVNVMCSRINSTAASNSIIAVFDSI